MKKLMSILTISFLLLFSSLNFAQTASGLIGYWPFSGNTNDLSGYNDNGSIHNVTLTTDRFGNANSAYYFSGNAYISCGTNIPQVYNQMTISVWIKTNTTTNTTSYIVGKYGWTSVAKGYNVMVQNTSFLFSFRDGNNDFSTINSVSGIYNDNKWHHILGTVNNSLYSLWIDGVKLGTYNNGHQTVDLSQAYTFYIGNIFNGSSDWNEYFIGSIDDIRLYNRALTDTEIIALYQEKNWPVIQYTVTTNCNPTTGGSAIGSGVFSYNSNVQVTAVPNAGYNFVNWTENGIVVSTNPVYSFNITNNRNLVANFKINTFTVTIGCLPSSGGTASGSGVYNYNTNVQVTAIPNSGYRFVNWTENGTDVSTNATYSFTITGNRNLIANFYQYSCTIVTSSNPAAGGATGGSGSYDTGTNVLVIATPNPKYFFVNWTENGNEVSKSPYYSFTASGDRNLVANFSTIPTLLVSPLYIGVPSNAGTGVFSVTNTTGGSMNWNAFSNSSWITITSGSSGTNSGTINLSYQANTGNYRVGTILVSADGAIGDPQTVEIRQSTSTKIEDVNIIPTRFILNQNYPNPFNPSTRIQFGIPKESFIILKVYDLLGNEIETLIKQTLSPGTYFANFDAGKLNNGIYFYRLQAGEYSQTKKMILLK
jgi:hypothetical protein